MEESSNSSKDFSFRHVSPNIKRNSLLREPQREAALAIAEHFSAKTSPSLVQVPVGCGKTGLISILPFLVAARRTLIVAPNLTIRQSLFEAVDSGSKQCFWRKTKVALATPSGPFAAQLDGSDVNMSDFEQSHFVVSNVQQLGQANSKWLNRFPPGFFDLILFDEGHHNAATSWKRLMQHFPNAKIVSLTATPFRSDGQTVIGDTVYRYPFLRAMSRGYIKTLKAVHVQPRELAFTFRDSPQEVSLTDVLKLREEVWFSRGVALADECNRHIVRASIAACQGLRERGKHHQIIAAACSVDHAERIAKLYNEAGFRALQIHSQLPATRQRFVLQQLRDGKIDAIVQVQMLGEGFDHPPLSVAAVFRPFRTLSPYIQFVGRIMRVIKQQSPGDPDNQGVVISHVGLNTERHWTDFRELDDVDQGLWAGLADGHSETERPKSANACSSLEDGRDEKTFTPNMMVNWEIAGEATNATYGELDGFDQPADHADTISQREAERQIEGPQERRRQARSMLKDSVDAAIRDVLRVTQLHPSGRQISRSLPHLRGMNNWSGVRFWMYCELNRALKRRPGTAQLWSLAEIELAVDTLPQLALRLQTQLATQPRCARTNSRSAYAGWRSSSNY